MTMDREAIFTKAVEGIFAQGKLAYEDNGCRYLARDGSKCAIGQLLRSGDACDHDLEDSVPEWIMDHRTEEGKPNHIARLVGAETESDVKFLRDLQKCHDRQTENTVHGVGMQMARFHLAARMFALCNNLDEEIVTRAYCDYQHRMTFEEPSNATPAE